MKNNRSSAANCLTVDTVWCKLEIERAWNWSLQVQLKRLHEIKVEDAIAIVTLSLFLAGVIDILHRI